MHWKAVLWCEKLCKISWLLAVFADTYGSQAGTQTWTWGWWFADVPGSFDVWKYVQSSDIFSKLAGDEKLNPKFGPLDQLQQIRRLFAHFVGRSPTSPTWSSLAEWCSSWSSLDPSSTLKRSRISDPMRPSSRGAFVSWSLRNKLTRWLDMIRYD